jgi:hypothetical protein
MSWRPVGRPVASSDPTRWSWSVGMDHAPVEPTVLHHVHATPVGQERRESARISTPVELSSKDHELEFVVVGGRRPIGSGSTLDRTPLLHLLPAPTVSMGHQGSAS